MTPRGTLIVKLGALGDVVRTTPLLRVLRGPVTWVTGGDAAALLPRRAGLEILAPTDVERLRDRRYRLVLSLDDDPVAARIAAIPKALRRVGAVPLPGGKTGYTASARPWFDMGLLSRFGRRRANALKLTNTLSWQAHLFRMAGSAFAGEEYWLREPPLPPRSRAPTVGLETRAGERWPLKIWGRFDEFEQALKAEGIRVTRFGWKSSLAEHEAAVASCDVVVCGDTLTMHLALALRRRVVALFLCTPPQEIEDYGRMTKIISPLITRHLYSRRHNRPAAEAIPVAAVLAETRAALAQASPR